MSYLQRKKTIFGEGTQQGIVIANCEGTMGLYLGRNQ